MPHLSYSTNHTGVIKSFSPNLTSKRFACRHLPKDYFNAKRTQSKGSQTAVEKRRENTHGEDVIRHVVGAFFKGSDCALPPRVWCQLSCQPNVLCVRFYFVSFLSSVFPKDVSPGIAFKFRAKFKIRTHKRMDDSFIAFFFRRYRRKIGFH